MHVGLGQDVDGRVLLGASMDGGTGDQDEGEEIAGRHRRRALRLVPALAGLEVAETRIVPAPDDAGRPAAARPRARRPTASCWPAATTPQGITWGPGGGAAVAVGIVDGTWDPALLPERAG